ncbi:ead/Ea22-like family protein [Serratia marcescens]|nr:ead/Ea22-like family protein [Serratia marcescens]MBH3041560.1 ead/Ea22-like family protein [Serratia marcescens]
MKAMDKFNELKAAAMAATPGRIGDRIDGSGSIKYECTGYDGSLVLRTDHKDMEYGFVGDNSDADELFFRLCVPDVVLELLAELEAKDERIGELEAEGKVWASAATKHLERAEEAEKRLATPVRLPPVQHREFLGLKIDSMDAEQVRIAIRAAGFKVKGDE